MGVGRAGQGGVSGFKPGGGGASDIDALGDVTITTPADGDVLTWDDGTSQWVNEPAGGGFGPEEDALEGDLPILTILAESDSAEDYGTLRFRHTDSDGAGPIGEDAELGRITFQGQNTDEEWFTGAFIRVRTLGEVDDVAAATELTFGVNDGTLDTENPQTPSFRLNGQNGAIGFGNAGTSAFLDPDALTDDRTFAVPDASGQVAVIVTTPAAATDPCVAGTVAYDGDFFYVCIATDTWERTALSTW